MYILPTDAHPIVTSHRNKIVKTNRIYVDLTTQIIKSYKTINVYCPDKAQSVLFLAKINQVFKAANLPRAKDIEAKPLNELGDYTDSIEWYKMPEFHPNSSFSHCVHILLDIEVADIGLFRTLQERFIAEFGYSMLPTKKTIWFPSRDITTIKDKMFLETVHFPKYPVYIISKGRYEKRYTSRYLEWCSIPYKIVVEPQEYAEYAKRIAPSNILVLPDEYLNKQQGGIPARNFVWQHSKDAGAKKHWILDDNIVSYHRYYQSQKILVRGGSPFAIVEDYVDRYDNVKMAGHNYTCFAVTTNTKLKPVTMNTRIYSSILLSNDIFPEIQWRGKYNEDTDLSLRILKAGYPTVLFNCLLANKLKTLSQKGGNTDTIYSEENALFLKAESLREQHPDVSTIIQRFGRTHHSVNYNSFKGLKPKGHVVPEDADNYNMELVKKDNRGLLL